MSAKRTKKPTAEHVEHAKPRPNAHPRESQIPSPRAANHGKPGQKPVDAALNQHGNLGPGRQRTSAPEPDQNAPRETGAPRTHKPPGSDKLGANGFARKVDMPRSNRIPVPERSELRSHGRGSEAARPKPAPPRAEPKVAVAEDESDVAEASVASYEPGYMLSRNAEYFDVDQDGVIWPRDTYAGCRKLGWGITSSSLAMIVLHSALSYPTKPGLIPDPLSRICYHKQDHHDEEEKNTTVPASEGILAEYNTCSKGGLSLRDVLRFSNKQRSQHGISGWCTALVEWLALYIFLWPRDGIMRSADIRAAFDGNILYKQAGERQRGIDNAKKPAETESRDRTRSGVSNPVKLAVALVTGAAIVYWALRNKSHDGTEKYYDTRGGGRWVDAKLFGV
ncbi:Caleosin related protein-domain-containing protein [Hypoxylon sp. FL1150]|nr:Caleosin related protein-domain-containing protein [Hypoxylon sp. FL1150]